MFRRLVIALIWTLAVIWTPHEGDARSVKAGHPPRTFTAGGVTITYPGNWFLSQFTWASRFSTSLFYVSSVPLHRPCVGQPISKTCQGPVPALPQNGVLMTWTENGFPGWTFSRARGSLFHVGHRRASLQMVKPTVAWCPRNTTRMLDVIIARPEAPDNWYEVRACLRGPDLKGVQGQAMTVVRSFRASHAR